MISLFLAAVCAVVCLGDDWKQISPAELGMKQPKVEKDADAEILEWEVLVDDSQMDLVFNHYLRIRIFTERGVESRGKVEITYPGWHRVKDIAARTIKADGSIVELKKDSVYERTVFRISGLKLRARTFAMPGIEPGCIIEYRYREVHSNSSAADLKLYFQEAIPAHSVKYMLKPAPGLGSMQAITFNAPPGQGQAGFVREKNGFYSLQMTNVPAYREEPRMIPEDKVRTWLLVYYRNAEKLDVAKYWNNPGKRLYEEFKPKTKPNDDVKRAAAEITAGAASDAQKLEKILEFCRLKIKNVRNDTTELTEEERKKLRENNNPGDTLKRGYGNGNDIDFLFA
ncbi:MAG: DUF3857 domain-containing protein, partial [Blastocatellia bacterium]